MYIAERNNFLHGPDDTKADGIVHSFLLKIVKSAQLNFPLAWRGRCHLNAPWVSYGRSRRYDKGREQSL
jgi:hypothetical protein